MKHLILALMLLGGTLLSAPAFAEDTQTPGKDVIQACASGDHACCEHMTQGGGCCCCCKGDGK